LGISIIICSKSKIALNRVTQNITDTIGCVFELIHEDNNENNSSLSSVYNRLQKIAQYPFVIFLHEDVLFYSQNWGFVVQKILSCKETGLLGLSGSIYKSKFPSVWSSSLQSGYRISGEQFELISVQDSLCNKVAVIDGCFIAARKNVIETHSFDENLNGFHGYDIDISLEIGKHYDVVVAKDINFTHLSNGIQNLDWLLSSIYIHNKWKNHLPIFVKKISKASIEVNDYLAAQNVYNVIYNLRYSAALLLKYYLLFIFKFFKLNRFKYTKKTFLYFFSNKSKVHLF
jgi:hypothetical protein